MGRVAQLSELSIHFDSADPFMPRCVYFIEIHYLWNANIRVYVYTSVWKKVMHEEGCCLRGSSTITFRKIFNLEIRYWRGDSIGEISGCFNWKRLR